MNLISGDTIIRIKNLETTTNVGASVAMHYEINGSSEIGIFHKGTYFKGVIRTHHEPFKELYRISIGGTYVDLTSDSQVETTRGIKQVVDLRPSDLIACYEPDEDFSNNGVAFKTIYSITLVNRTSPLLYSCEITNGDRYTINNGVILFSNKEC